MSQHASQIDPTALRQQLEMLRVQFVVLELTVSELTERVARMGRTRDRRSKAVRRKR